MIVTDDDEGNDWRGRGCGGSGAAADDDGVIGGKLLKWKD